MAFPELTRSIAILTVAGKLDETETMARALLPEEEGAIDYKVVEWEPRKRRLFNCGAFAAVLVFSLFIALVYFYIIRHSGASPQLSTPQNNSVTPSAAAIHVQKPEIGDCYDDGENNEKWNSFLMFKELAPRAPLVPSRVYQWLRHELGAPNGSCSLLAEVHPKEYCLLVLSRSNLRDQDLANHSVITKCFGRLAKNLRTSDHLYDLDVEFVLPKCKDVPLIPVMQIC